MLPDGCVSGGEKLEDVGVLQDAALPELTVSAPNLTRAFCFRISPAAMPPW